MSKDRKPVGKKKINWKRNLPYLALILPPAIYTFIFKYLPMFGVVMAFKDYNYRDGILGSPWAGFKHFKYFFQSDDAWRIIRNTIGYNVLFEIIGLVLGVFLAILLYEVTSKRLARTYHISMLLPYFISWVVVAYIGYIFLSHSNGVLNQIIEFFGGQPINWYQEPKYWPYILTFFQFWKNAGMGCVFYYAALMNLDSSMFEAASIDGASRVKQWMKIGIPSLAPVICILLIMHMGGILGGDFGLYYQLSMDSGPLYPATDVISTYIYRGLTASTNMSQTAAIGLLTNSVGLILVLLTNSIVRKLDPDSAMF